MRYSDELKKQQKEALSFLEGIEKSKYKGSLLYEEKEEDKEEVEEGCDDYENMEKEVNDDNETEIEIKIGEENDDEVEDDMDEPEEMDEAERSKYRRAHYYDMVDLIASIANNENFSTIFKNRNNVMELIDIFVDMFTQDNPNFKPEFFKTKALEACQKGVQGGEEVE